MIVGFVVSGDGVATVLLRVVGPTLAESPFNLSNTVSDPQLALYKHEPDGTQTLIVQNDDWGLSPDSDNTRDTAIDVFAFPLIEGGADAAAVVTLHPGIYSVVGSGLDPNDAGTIIVEAYRVD
jgi:hypothetical protein